MTAALYYNPFVPAFSNTGVAISGAKLYFFLTGSVTPTPVYSDATLTTALAHPVVANLAGKYPDIYLDSDITYRVRQTDPSGVPLGDDIDPYVPGEALRGLTGATGPANNTYTDLTEFKAQDVSNVRATLVLDGKGTDYVLVTSDESGNSLAIESTETAGNYWVPSQDDAFIVGDDDADNTAVLQADIDDLLYTATGNARSRKLQLKTGTSITSDVIHVGYGTDFRGLHIYGQGNSYGGNVIKHPGNSIEPTQLDRPAVDFAGARNSGLHDMALVGPLDSAIETDVLADFDISDPDAAWDDIFTAEGGTPNLRYATLCGVSVDAYSGTRPTPSYPDTTYPEAIVGVVPQYGKNSYSSLIELDNVTIAGFETCYVNKPSDQDSQGDWLLINGQTQFENAKYGISIGNSQFRSNSIGPIRFRNVHTCLITNKHGKQVGRAPTNFYCNTAQFVYQLFEFGSLNNITSCHIHGNCESLVRLGEIAGGGSGGAGLLTLSGKYNFRNSSANGIPAKLIEGAGDRGPVRLQNAELEVFGAGYFDPRNTYFDNVYVKQGETATKQYMQMAYNALSGGLLTDYIEDRAHDVVFTPYNVTTLTALHPCQTSNTFRRTDRNYGIPIGVKRAMFSSGLSGWFEKNNRSAPAYVVGAASRISSYSRTGTAISWINSRLTGEDSGHERGLVNGCVAIHDATGTIAVVRSYDAATGAQTLELLNNYKGSDLIDTSTAFTAGNWYFFPSVFAPSKRLYGTITDGSAIITDVQTDGGTDLTDYDLAVGDRFATLYYDQPYFAGSSSSSNAPITAIDTAANTITLGRNATVSGASSTARVALDFWQIEAPADEASR